MIRFDYLENNKEQLREEYLLAKPFPHLAIDKFCDEEGLRRLMAKLPDIKSKSRDYIFANNKFEKSKISEISEEFAELHADFMSARFQDFLRYVTNEDLFVDPSFHGGGLHQGKENSFLDMHLDFNYHPMHDNWYRNLNLLLYLNENWEEEHGGQLKLEDLRTGEKKEIGVPYNRLVIQQTRAFTLHGYDRISFPQGKYRTSIAAYAYSEHKMIIEKPRVTDWFVKEDVGMYKKFFAKYSKSIIGVKNMVFGSATAKNA